MHFKFDRAFVSSGALELDVRLIPTLLVVAHDSNVAVYAHLAARVDPPSSFPNSEQLNHDISLPVSKTISASSYGHARMTPENDLCDTASMLFDLFCFQICIIAHKNN